MKRLLYLNPKLPSMLLAQGLYLIVCEAVIILALPHKLSCGVSFFAGVLYGFFATVHISYVINQMMYLPDKAAVRKSLGGFAIRLAVLLLIMFGCYFLGTDAMLAVLAGIFSMKVSAYIQPFTDKLIQKNTKKGR